MPVLSVPFRQAYCRLGTLTRFAVAAVALMTGPSVGDAAERREVQAVFLLNLTRFIKWPENAFPKEDADFVIGTLPNDPLNGILIAAAKGESAGGHPIKVRQVRTSADIDGCHLVYVSKPGLGEVAQMLATVRTKPVLTVSDADGFLSLGGHVQLYNRSGQMKLRLDLGNLKRAELVASAPLLRVAEVIGN